MSTMPGTPIPSWIGRVQPDALRVWADILHDPNPIHLDAAYVRENGLGDAEINQGPANLAYVLNALMDAFPDGRIESLAIRFVGNVFAGEAVEGGGDIIGSTEVDGDSLITCEVWLKASGKRVVLTGQAAIRQPAHRPADAA